MAPSVTAASSVVAAATDAAAPHYISVLMCSGPASGMVFAVHEQDLVHRRKKLDIGAHVLVKQHDGSKRVKGVIVHMNPLINARVPPPAQATAVPVASPPRQRPSKRPREQPSLTDVEAVQAAKRFKPCPSRPTTLPGVSSFQPAMLQKGPNGEVLFTDFCPVIPEPGVNRCLFAAPVSEELDDIVSLDCLNDIITPDELGAFVTQAVEDAEAPVALVSPLHSTPVSALPIARPDITPFFNSEFRPLRPAPFSRRLFAAGPQVNGQLRGFRADRRITFRHDDGLLRCGLPDLLMSSPRLG